MMESTIPDLLEIDPELPSDNILLIRGQEKDPEGADWESMDTSEIAFFLLPAQMAFCESYLQHWDKKRAALDAGYSDKNLVNSAYTLMSKPKIKTYIKKRLQEKALPADRVLAEIAEIAMIDIGDFMAFPDVGEGRTMVPFFDLQRARENGKLKHVKRIRYLDKGGIELELYDKQWALELLAKHLGLLKEVEVNVDNYIIKVVRE